MTRDEFNSILEEVFYMGYEDAIDEIERSMTEDLDFDLESDIECYVENTVHKHPLRAMLSRSARASEKYGVPRETTYRMAQKAAQGAYKAAKSGANDFEAGRAGTINAVKDWMKHTSLHDRINQRASNDKVIGYGKSRKNRIDALTDEVEKQTGKKFDRSRIAAVLKQHGIDKKNYNG